MGSSFLLKYLNSTKEDLFAAAYNDDISKKIS